ncbi:MAG TPA: maleylpyruvate isomerase family mycothiol-dependent enzyme [Pseudonocardiaceae bacterium]|nr:maleylpyruvate isomerase family mycothiol-dependent enzyme [Pseudonocardiaceae bacterium]
MPPLERLLSWQDEGTDLVEKAVATVTDAELAQPSALPGWTRAHVVGHLARNADALVNLLTWARTGVESPMYAAPGRREEDIDATALLPPARLRADLVAANARLATAVAELPADAWRARVRSAQGRDIPAGEVPWLRVRELWLHVVDLGGRWTFADLPAELIVALLADVTSALDRKPTTPALSLVATGAGEWTIGPAAPVVTVTGSPADLLGWVAGRTAGAELTTSAGYLPTLPRWL